MHFPPRASTAVIAALLLLAVAFAGCGGDDSKSSDMRALVTFAKSGTGGKAYALTVDRGGGAQLTTYPSKIKKFKIDGDKRDELVGLLDGFNSLRSTYEPTTPDANAFRYSVTYEGKSVQAADNAKLPDKLRSVIDLLDDIVDDET